jgi:hypothetical protein
VGANLPPRDRGDYEHAVREARAGLDPAAFEAAWSAGRKLELAEAAGLGLAREALTR